MTDQNFQRMYAEVQYNTYRICDLLGWSLETYNQHLFDTGVQYLESYFHNQPEAVRRLSLSARFWSWFVNLWNARNQAFREEWDGLEDSISQEEFRQLYFDIHRSAVMTAEIAPPRCVFPEDFATIKIEMA